jgi:hypothetical protein
MILTKIQFIDRRNKHKSERANSTLFDIQFTLRGENIISLRKGKPVSTISTCLSV